MRARTSLLPLWWSVWALWACGGGSTTETAEPGAATAGAEVAAPQRPTPPERLVDCMPGGLQVFMRLDGQQLRDAGLVDLALEIAREKADEPEMLAVSEYLASQTDEVLFGFDVLAAAPADASGDDKDLVGLAVARGRYGGFRTIAAFSEQQFATDEHGYVILTDDGKTLGLALDERHLVIGDAPMVRAMIETMRDAKRRASRLPEFMELQQAAGLERRAAAIIGIVPPDAGQRVRAQGGDKRASEMFASAARDVVGLSATLDVATDVELAVAVHARDESSAEQLAAMARLLAALGTEEAPQELKTELSAIRIETVGRQVRASLRMPLAEVKARLREAASESEDPGGTVLVPQRTPAE